MATRIVLKNSVEAGKVPLISDLVPGELALNLTDKKLYSKTPGGESAEVFEIGSGRVNGGTTPPASGDGIGDLFFDTTTNQLLYWDGDSWEPVEAVLSLNDLTDVEVTGVTDKQVLVYNATNSQWEAVSPSTLTVDVDLGYTAAVDQGTVTNSAGDNAVIPAVASDKAGLMTPTQLTKLDSIPNDLASPLWVQASGVLSPKTNTDSVRVGGDAAAPHINLASSGYSTFRGDIAIGDSATFSTFSAFLASLPTFRKLDIQERINEVEDIDAIALYELSVDEALDALPNVLSEYILRNTTAGKINLNSDGTAAFAGKVDIGDWSGSSAGVVSGPSGYLHVRKDGGTNAIAVWNGDNSSATASINPDGSATFAAGKLTIDERGVIRRPGSGGDYVTLGNFNNSGTTTGATGGRLILASDANGSVDNETIVLNGLDGSATFAGDVQAGGAPESGANTGSKLKNNGAVLSSVANTGDVVYRAFQTGGSTDGVITFKGDGSATFAGGVEIGDWDGNNGAKIYAWGETSIRGTLTCQNATTGDDCFIALNKNSSGRVFQGKDTSTNAVTTEIKADGSASFASNIDTGGGVVSPPNGYGTRVGTGEVIIRDDNANTAGTLRILKGGGDYNTHTTAVINNDGSASFAGTVKAGNVDINSTTTKGVIIYPNGNVLAQRDSLQAGESGVFSGYKGNVRTSLISNDGSASFAGVVEVEGGGIHLGAKPGVAGPGTVIAQSYIADQPNSGNPVFIGRGNGVDNVNILGNGSATFAGTVRVNATDSGLHQMIIYQASNTEPGMYAINTSQASIDAKPDKLVYSVYNANTAKHTVGISQSGSASFAGNVQLKPPLVDAVLDEQTNKLDFSLGQTNGQGANLASIYAEGKNAWGGDLIISTKSSDSNPGSAPVERMRINNAGNATFAGQVEAKGGIKFGDGTTMTTAASGGTNYWSDNGSSVFPNNNRNVVVGNYTNFNNDGFCNLGQKIHVNTNGYIHFNRAIGVSNILNADNSGTIIEETGTLIVSRNGNATLFLNRRSSQGNILSFNFNGSEKGSFSIGDSYLNYNGQLGYRSSLSSDLSREALPELKRGTVLSVVEDEPVLLKDGSEGIEPRSRISRTLGDRLVAGVFCGWTGELNEETGVIENEMMDISTSGTSFIRIDKDAVIAAGDLLESAGNGTAKVQDDDLIRSKTIAKVTGTIPVETYEDGSYLVRCRLMVS